MPNLRNPSHSLRLHTLQILACLPKRAFVTDHADLYLEGDLDEEVDSSPVSEAPRHSGPVGICDLMDTLLQLEEVPVCLPKERILMSLVSKVESLGRTGKLPVVYAEVAANHMLGLFHVKFAPIWGAASRAIVALAFSHEKIIWPILESELKAVMNRPPTVAPLREVACNTQSDCMSSALLHHKACLDWQESTGMDVSIFCPTPFPENEGIVPRNQTTDVITVMESVWKIAEEGQQLFTRNSRSLVSIFINHLHGEYFSYYSSDPEARELNLEDHCHEIDRYVEF